MKKILIIIVIVILALLFVFFNKKNLSFQNRLENTPSSVPPEFAGGASGQFAPVTSNTIHVLEQLPGGEVYVNVLNIENPGFVVITKTKTFNEEGIIGLSAWHTKGYYSGLSILTTEKIVENTDYFAWIVVDDGNGIFDPKIDKLAMSQYDKKTPIMTEFIVSRDAKDPKTIQINF